jgi:hypothetical protein
MSQFAQSGSAMDAAIGEDADRFFDRVNQRLQLNQLQEGEVRESLNGRMEGYWKPRKNVVSRTGALTTGGSPLQLPFLLTGTSVLITAASVTAGVVTLTTGSAHGLAPGATLNIAGIGYTTGSDPNGVFTAATASASTITYALASGSGTYTVSAVEPISEVITSTSKAIASSSLATNVVTITITAGHGFAIDTIGYGLIAGLTFTGTDPNGLRLLTYASATTMTFPVTAATTAVSGAGTLSQAPINDDAAANVLASCLFSDPNDSNKEYVIIALDTVAKKIDLDGYAITDIPYPAGEALGADTDMIQVFDKVMLFREGQQALEWYPNGRPVISASSNATASPNTVVTVNLREHGLVVGTSITVAGLTNGTPPSGTYTVATVTGQDTFTFLAASISTSTTFGVAVATVTDGFTLSPGGAYTQPQTFNIQAKDVEIVSGLVTATVAGNVTIKQGDIIIVRQAETVDFAEMVGKEYQVVSATTTTIAWYAPVGDYSTSSTDIFEFGGRFSVGGGFMHQPGAPWGVHFQRRLWVPFYYDQSGAYNNVTYTSRKITDEISVSDILDTTTFDQIENQFRVSGGTADFVVAMHGFYDDGLVVLNRNSLHLVKGTLGSLLDVTVKELTSEIGCLARKSVVMRGNAMLFLSDDGVYGIEFLNDYNLRGTEEPLSKNIQPYIDRINADYADKAVGILFENRYYLAVPLDSIPGAGDSYGNNAILVYNFLNKGWESLDTFGDSRFLIKDFVIGSASERNNIYAVTSNGGLHQIEASESSNDTLNVDNSAAIVSPAINAALTTRGYDLGTMERKRFTDAQINIQSLPGQNSEYDIAFAAEDPDDAQSIGTTTTLLGGLLTPTTVTEAETASIRCRLGGIRGFTGTMILTRTIGSPKVNSVKVAGSVTNRQIISQR